MSEVRGVTILRDLYIWPKPTLVAPNPKQTKLIWPYQLSDKTYRDKIYRIDYSYHDKTYRGTKPITTKPIGGQDLSGQKL